MRLTHPVTGSRSNLVACYTDQGRHNPQVELAIGYCPCDLALFAQLLFVFMSSSGRSQHAQEGRLPHAAAFLCNAPVGGRRPSLSHSSVARAQEPQDHVHLHAPAPELCTTILQSTPTKALTESGLMARTRRGGRRNALQALHSSIAKRKEMTQYPRFPAEGLQIGPGPTESQCKCLTARLKGRGRRWNRQGSDPHLAVSCLSQNPRQGQIYRSSPTMP